LIQEEHDQLQAMNLAVFLKSIACTFPPSATRRRGLASVLDLEQYHLSGSDRACKQVQRSPRSIPYSGDQTILMLISINDVNSFETLVSNLSRS
jgi:hypothetical protein